MHVLVTWKSQNLSHDNALARWTQTIDHWKSIYQALVDEPLHIATVHTETLFLGLIYTPGLFRHWQEFYQDATVAVAWSGIAYDLLDTLGYRTQEQMNAEFVRQLRKHGEQFLRELNGRFVVSLLDRQQQALQIITTANGLTPCFQTQGKFGIAIGSRIAPLLKLVGNTARPNRAALIQMFAMDWSLGSHTAFEGVTQIDAGMQLTVRQQEPGVQASCYHSPQQILDQAATLTNTDYLAAGSDALTQAIARQMRHTTVPLMNLTGGLDSRTIAATVVASGHHPECDVSGLANSREITIATELAATMHLKLHRLLPGEHYAENLDTTLRLWSLWTEGTIPVYIGFARSAFALSPQQWRFFRPYRQSFCGVGGEVYRSGASTMSYSTEMLVTHFSKEAILHRMLSGILTRYQNDFITDDDKSCIRAEIQRCIDEACALGLTEHRIFDYVYWRERVLRWAGFGVDSQQFGRHVFTPLCHSTLYAMGFAMTVAEKLSAAWNRFHIQRVLPDIAKIPYLKPPPLSNFKKMLFDLHPRLYANAYLFKQRYLTPSVGRTAAGQKRLPLADQEKLGAYFHPYLQELLFSGNQWWPQIIRYEDGQTIWSNFIRGIEIKPLWNLVTFELLAKNFFQSSEESHDQ